MLRAVLGVVLGLLGMTILVIAGFSLAYVALGSDNVFHGDGWEVTTLWIVLTSIAGLIAAIAGGALCAVIATRGSNAPLALIALLVVLGVGEAIYKHAVLYPANAAEPPARSDAVTMQDAANHAREPLYVSLMNPLLGAVGVFLGSRATGRQTRANPATP